VPKFKVEYGAALDEALRALGVKTAYDPDKADLTAMLDPTGLPGGQHYLDTVLHKTYIAVDEQGTEAAAVTAAMDGAGAAMPTRPELVRTFTADSPFYFAIRDNASGALLFVGRYGDAR
ncbi:MAG: serpin family protein, partial [Eubacteriales bacterium]|nr:serpin family protein [Eubacteriales bacterium]